MIEVESVGGQVRFDGTTLTIQRTSRIARSVFGETQTTIGICSVTAVEWRNASLWHAGHIRFAVPGGQAAAAPVPVNRDVHAVVFGRKDQGGFEKLRTAVQDAISP